MPGHSPINAENETRAQRRKRAKRIARVLREAYPDPRVELDHRNPFELLVATILSAQCTDVKVNQVTPGLFRRFPDAMALAGASAPEVEALVRQTGFYRQKAKSIQNCARQLVERFGGRVPEAMDDLTSLPGVGRKTANVIRANAMGLPGVIVDTHVTRLAGRLGLSANADAEKIERDLMALLPEAEWTPFSSALVLHGRRVCVARAPQCQACPLLPDCPHGQERR